MLFRRSWILRNFAGEIRPVRSQNSESCVFPCLGGTEAGPPFHNVPSRRTSAPGQDGGTIRRRRQPQYSQVVKWVGRVGVSKILGQIGLSILIEIAVGSQSRDVARTIHFPSVGNAVAVSVLA